MNLVEAMGAVLKERYALGPRSIGREPRTPITEPKGLEIRMRRIMDKFKGNRREAAKAAGVPYSTWNHALRGRNVTQKTLNKILGAFAKVVTAPARALRVKKVGYPDGDWLITAFVVADPGDEEPDPKRHGSHGGGGSRYVNGHGSGVTRDEINGLDPETDPGYRTFRAEGLDSKAIVNAWLSGGAEAATQQLLDEIEEAYGGPFGFEGDHVEVEMP